MELREQKGLEIAAKGGIRYEDGVFFVPSQHGKTKEYLVKEDLSACTCDDFALRLERCKHIYAVDYTLKGVMAVAREMRKSNSGKRPTDRDWTTYGRRKRSEKWMFMQVLHALCKTIPEVPRTRTGRCSKPVRDLVFAACLMAYTKLSGRRFQTDFQMSQHLGFIGTNFHETVLHRWIRSEGADQILSDLISAAAEPLAHLETRFAVDSTGFTTNQFREWNAENGGPRMHQWVKAHVMCGTATHIVTAIIMSNGHAADTMFLRPLLEKSNERFGVRVVTADTAYSSVGNLNAVLDSGGVPYIPFRSNMTGDGGGDKNWGEMYRFFHDHRERFLAYYHDRSNIETLFSSVKRQFGWTVRAKSRAGQKNEVLCKFLCHNVCCLLQAMMEHDVYPEFLK
jgi:hypothetical protein